MSDQLAILADELEEAGRSVEARRIRSLIEQNNRLTQINKRLRDSLRQIAFFPTETIPAVLLDEMPQLHDTYLGRDEPLTYESIQDDEGQSTDYALRTTVLLYVRD